MRLLLSQMSEILLGLFGVGMNPRPLDRAMIWSSVKAQLEMLIVMKISTYVSMEHRDFAFFSSCEVSV